MCSPSIGAVRRRAGRAPSKANGAAGVMCGTAFSVRSESLVHPNLKRAAVAGEGDRTLRSSVIDVARDIPWPEEFNIRTLRNGFIEQWADDVVGLRASRAQEQARYAQGHDAGDPEVSAVIVGEGIDLIHAETGAGDVVRGMVGEAESRLRAAAAILQSA